jgi:hypothetical protein
LHPSIATAYAIFTFLSFLIAVLGRGDRATAIRVLSRHADRLKDPTRCLSSCYHPPPHASDEAKAGAVVTECQLLAMQFVFIRPLTSILGFVYSTLYESRHPTDNTSGGADGLSGTAVAAYFTSPPFFLAMVTNVSVFLAFMGLLKFYHAVRDDLSWCQPFSKFMTIKGIVFLTFWQGLLISIVVSALDRNARYGGNVKSIQHPPASGGNSTNLGQHSWAPPGSSPSSSYSFHNGTDRFLLDSQQPSYASFDEAAQIQNFLICLEMLFFSIAHYCVFPAEEWEPGYRPRAMARPGIGLKDFVSDMSYIIKSRRNRTSRSAKGCVPVPSFEDLEDGDEADIDDRNGEPRAGAGTVASAGSDDAEESESGASAGFPDVLALALGPDPEEGGNDVLRRRSGRPSSDDEGHGSPEDGLVPGDEVSSSSSAAGGAAAASAAGEPASGGLRAIV